VIVCSSVIRASGYGDAPDKLLYEIPAYSLENECDSL